MLVNIIQYAVKAPRIDVLFRGEVMFHWRLIADPANPDIGIGFSSLRGGEADAAIQGPPATPGLLAPLAMTRSHWL
jgi:hypothetical protein